MLCGKLRSKITGTLKVTLIISFVAQVDQWAPRVGTHEPALGTNEPCVKQYKTVGSLLQDLYVPFVS